MSKRSKPVYFAGAPFGPDDARAHQKVMKFLRDAPDAEFLASMVHAGIWDRDGHLLPPFTDEVHATTRKARDTAKRPRRAAKRRGHAHG